MYVMTKDGKKLPVDVTGVEDPFKYVGERFKLYSDSTRLVPVWVLTLEKFDPYCFPDSPLDFHTEIIFPHEPSAEEILRETNKRNMRQNDVAHVHKAFRLVCEKGE